MFPKNIKILIVDDMAMFRLMVKQTLVDLEYKNYFEAPDGLKAWDAIEAARSANEPFQLILCDWSMPKMKGIDLLRKVRAEPWGAALPFIMLTGETEKSFILEAIEYRVTHYIVKPFTPDSFKLKLKQAYDKVKASSPDIVYE